MIYQRTIRVLGFVVASCVSPQLIAQNFDVVFMKPLIRAFACLDSIIATPSESQGCVSFTRSEEAGALFDAKRGVVYVGGSDQKFHVLSAGDGRLLRLADLPGKLISQPTLAGDRLYFGTENGQVVRLNPDTLQSDWVVEVDAEVTNSLVYDDRTLYLTTGLATIYALDAQTGKEKWQRKRPVFTTLFLGPTSRVLIYDLSAQSSLGKILVAGHPSGTVGFYSATSGSSLFDVSIGDVKRQFPDIVSDPIFLGDEVVVASYNRGIFFLDSWTGAVRGQLPEIGITRLAYENGKIFAGKEKQVLGIEQSSRHVAWQFSFSEGVPTRFVTQNGLLFFGSDRGGIFILDQATGKQMQRSIGSGLGFFSDFDFSSGTLYAVSGAGYLFALDSKLVQMLQGQNRCSKFALEGSIVGCNNR